MRPSRVENLDLLTAGPEVSNPAELLASPHLASALKEMRQAYDVVIVDSPPLLAVADPSILAQVVDAILLVVRTTTTRQQDVERTVELLRALGAPVLGAVINGITQDEIGDRYGYAYRYDYGYGYGPGEGVEPVEGPGRPARTHRRGRLPLNRRDPRRCEKSTTVTPTINFLHHGLMRRGNMIPWVL